MEHAIIRPLDRDRQEQAGRSDAAAEERRLADDAREAAYPDHHHENDAWMPYGLWRGR